MIQTRGIHMHTITRKWERKIQTQIDINLPTKIDGVWYRNSKLERKRCPGACCGYMNGERPLPDKCPSYILTDSDNSFCNQLAYNENAYM
jgi:hypothetical protein